MIRSELVRRSPLRIFDSSIHGGLQPGEIGVLASRKGVGKTACLVHIATDKLFQGQHVIHVSFSSRTDHIITWYEDIFGEIARKRHLEDALSVHDDLIKNRVIMNFSQDGISTDAVIRGLRAMIGDGGFAAEVLVVDGYDFGKGIPDAIRQVADFAREVGLSVWFSATIHREDPPAAASGVPHVLGPYIDLFSVLVTLSTTDGHVRLNLVKDGDQISTEPLHLELDPKTLLIAGEDE